MSSADDILGHSRPVIRPSPPTSRWIAYPLYIVGLVVAYHVAQFAWVRFLAWRQEEHRLQNRRKWGIPDSDKRPFNVAYAAVKAKENSRRTLRRPVQPQPPPQRESETHRFPEPAAQEPSRPDPVSSWSSSVALPGGLPGEFRRTESHTPAWPRYNDAQVPAATTSAPPAQLEEEPPKRGAKRGLESADHSPSNNEKRARKVSIEDPKDVDMQDESVEYDDEMEVDDYPEASVLPVRGKKRGRAEAGSTFGDAPESTDAEQRKEKRRRRKSKRTSEIAPEDLRGVKRGAEDEEGETGWADKSTRKKKKGKSRSSTLEEAFIHEEDGEMDDDMMDPDAHPQRAIGEEWTSGGIKFKIGPNGQRLREVLLRKEGKKFAMPTDTAHPDLHARLTVFVETWLDDEDYAKAKEDGRLAWQDPDPSTSLIVREKQKPEGLVLEQSNMSSLPLGKSLLYASSNPATPLSTPGSSRRPSLTPLPAIAGPEDSFNSVDRLTASNLRGSTTRPRLSYSSSRPSSTAPSPTPTPVPLKRPGNNLRDLRGYSKWEKQDLEAESMLRLRAKQEAKDSGLRLEKEKAEAEKKAEADRKERELKEKLVREKPAPAPPAAAAAGGFSLAPSPAAAPGVAASAAPTKDDKPKQTGLGFGPPPPQPSQSSQPADSGPSSQPQQPQFKSMFPSAPPAQSSTAKVPAAGGNGGFNFAKPADTAPPVASGSSGFSFARPGAPASSATPAAAPNPAPPAQGAFSFTKPAAPAAGKPAESAGQTGEGSLLNRMGGFQAKPAGNQQQQATKPAGTATSTPKFNFSGFGGGSAPAHGSSGGLKPAEANKTTQESSKPAQNNATTAPKFNLYGGAGVSAQPADTKAGSTPAPSSNVFIATPGGGSAFGSAPKKPEEPAKAPSQAPTVAPKFNFGFGSGSGSEKKDEKTATTATSNAFGGGSSAPFGAPASGSAPFGSSGGTGFTKTDGNKPFGGFAPTNTNNEAKAPSSTSSFGPSSSTTLFGGATPSTPAKSNSFNFAAGAGSTTPAGEPPKTGFGAPANSAFGGAKPATGFGTTPASTPPAAPSTSGFGGATASSTAPKEGGSGFSFNFGAAKPAGEAAPNSSPFGGASASGGGDQNKTGFGFGGTGASTTPFGTPSSKPAFGGFGGGSSSNSFDFNSQEKK